MSFSHKPFIEVEVKIVNLMMQQKTFKEIVSILQEKTGTIRTHREKYKKKCR